MRPAEAQRHPEPLGGADGGVRAQLAGRGQQGQRQQVRGDGDQRAPLVRLVDQRRRVAHHARRPGVGQQQPEQLAVGQPVVEVGDDQLDAQRLGAGAQHLERLRQRVRVDDEPGGLRAFPARRSSVIASAAAVASSSSDAPATGRPVRSATVVWNVSSASSRPWLISGWYGVYAVYQAGFSSTLRRITGGVTVPL